MKETLTCNICGKDWKRDITRGRKPKMCKKCLKQVLKQNASPPAAPVQLEPEPAKPARRRVKAQPIEQEPVQLAPASIDRENESPLDLRQVWNMLYPKPNNWRELFEDTKNGSVWQCPQCKWRMEVSIGLTDVPTHKCTPASRSRPLERVSS